MNLDPDNVEWKVQTLIDTAFPCGAFAHSQGLESTFQVGQIESAHALQNYTETNMTQLYKQFHGIFTYTFQYPAAIQETDSISASLLSNHITNSASIRQGRAFAKASSQIFDIEAIQGLWRAIDNKEIIGHQVPVLAFIFKQLNCSIKSAMQYWLLMHTKSLLSAAVRLNIIGPTQSMRLLLKTENSAKELINSSPELSPPLLYSCQSSPLLDITQAMQDRLYTKLFQS